MRWSAADLRGTVAALEEWWGLLAAGIPETVARVHRPAELDVLLAGDRTSLPAVEEVEAALAALSRAGRALAAEGYATKPHQGTLAGIFTGDGGVPKQPIDATEVTVGGLDGDRQRTRKYHGRIWQAVCLWSAEVVADLQAEGHPVFPGACGENLSLAGVEWAELRAGTRLRIGTARIELSLPTEPCRQIRPFFTGAAIRRIDHYRHPGSARWYASVVEPGRIAVDDGVEVEPAS